MRLVFIEYPSFSFDKTQTIETVDLGPLWSIDVPYGRHFNQSKAGFTQMIPDKKVIPQSIVMNNVSNKDTLRAYLQNHAAYQSNLLRVS